MKKSIKLLGVTLMLFAFIGKANAVPIDAAVTINGADFLQSFSLTNNSTTMSITEVVYSLGTAADGIATWNGGAGPFAGGVKSDFLSNPRWGQTITWSALNVVSGGGVFSIAAFTLDIDWITTLAPLVVNEGSIDNVGTSLANAFFGVRYSDGTFASVALNQTGWQVAQDLQIRAVPEPGTLALLSLGLIGLGLRGRRRSAV